ncbi:MAG TPA: sigma-70 family RNA polymerase sigma factor, partial [Miltoncostaea sp.]|nr:sigma-70 family RNA polymerase sigma factor [Miltoncostaea sp.]
AGGRPDHIATERSGRRVRNLGRRRTDDGAGADLVARDRRLVRAIRAGSEDAADELVRAYLPRSYRAALLIVGDRHLAEDVVQDAFERALRALDRFDDSRPFGPWLHRIVANRALDTIRRREEPFEFNDEQHGDRDPYALADASRELIEAVGRLPQERRVVVVLRLLFGYTPDEVAAMLDVRVGTVHSRLSRGLDQLRDHLGVPDEA